MTPHADGAADDQDEYSRDADADGDRGGVGG